MGTTITPEVKVKRGAPGGGGPFDPGKGGNDWPPGYSRDDAIEPAKYRIGMWVGLASVVMLFVSLTSAYIFRQIVGTGEAKDWVPIQMPFVLWITTAVILASSVTIELARRTLRIGNYAGFSRWITMTTVLGLVFLIGQILAWRELVAQGIYINSNPHSSFFYLLTSLHGLHLAGGLVALGYITVAALRARVGIRKRNATEVTAIYWHFMDGLWIYLFVLLFYL